MREVQQRSRRFILLLSVVVTGSVLVFLDMPLPILISATFLTGFMVMILTGSLRLGGKRGEKGQSAPKKTTPAPGAEAERTKVRRSVFASFPNALAAVRAGIARFHARGRSPEEHVQKIDELLDQALADNPVPPQMQPALQKTAAPGAKPDVDPFLALSAAQLEDELLADDEESGDRIGDLQRLDVSLQGEEAPVQIEEETDEVDEILKTYETELSDLDDLGSTDALAQQFEDLGNVDLDALDPELQDGSAAGDPSPQQPPEPPAPPKAGAKPPEEPGGDMLAFASGSSGDDLLSTLRADAAPLRKGIDMSLVRELKDLKVDARDLERELEETLKKLKTART